MRALALLALAPVALVVVAVPAAAQQTDTASQRLELLGTAPAACVLGAPKAASASNAVFATTGSSSGQITISQFVNPQTANPVASAVSLVLPVTCNASHQITVRSANGGLLRAGGNAANRQRSNAFADFVVYDLGIDWIGRSARQASDRGTMLVSVNDGGTGEFALRVATPAGGGPLVAGRYDDTIVVEFHAAN